MVSRAKKPVLTLKNGPINNHNDWSGKLKDAWGVCKRVWQVPFLWTLTFYLFWAARDIFVWNKSLWEGNYWNYVGITVSVAALLAKTPLARRAIRATVVVGTQLKTTFSRIPFERVQTELHKTFVVAGTWTKKAVSSTVLNAASGLRRISAHVGTIIHGRIQAPHVYESAPTMLDNDVKKPISTNYLEHRPLGVQQRSSTAARKRAPPMQRRKLSMDTAPKCVDEFLPGDRVFDENSMQCLVCSHLMECFCDENKSGFSEKKHHTAMRCRFPKEPQSIEVVA
jgi:hypothetical protein